MGILEPLLEPVADVVGDRIALVGPVDRQPQHAVIDVRRQLFVDVDAFRRGSERHFFTTSASSATAPRGRTTNGLISSSRTSPAILIATSCSFIIVSTSA